MFILYIEFILAVVPDVARVTVSKIPRHLAKSRKITQIVYEFYSHDFIVFVFMTESDHHNSQDACY